MLSDALAWSVTAGAIAIGTILFVSSAIGMWRYRKGVDRCMAVKVSLQDVRDKLDYLAEMRVWAVESEPPGDDFSPVRSLVLLDALKRDPYFDLERLTAGTPLREMQEAMELSGRPGTEVTKEARQLIGSIPVEQLRRLKEYPAIVSFIANYEAGIRDAKAVVARSSTRPSKRDL